MKGQSRTEGVNQGKNNTVNMTSSTILHTFLLLIHIAPCIIFLQQNHRSKAKDPCVYIMTIKLKFTEKIILTK
jgi:hypothetical protein